MENKDDSIKKNISRNISKFRELAGMNQKELANKLGVTPSRISNWEQGANCPTIDILFEVCEILGISINDVYGIYPESNIMLTYDEQDHIKRYRALDDHGKEHINTVLSWETERIASSNYRKYLTEIESADQPGKIARLVCYCYGGVSAGDGIYMLGSEEGEEIEVPINGLTDRADYVVRVNGESMNPAYYDGDKVLVAQKETVDIGDIGIFVKNCEAFIKERGRYELISLNTDYPNIEIKDSDNIVCMGKVIGKLK